MGQRAATGSASAAAVVAGALGAGALGGFSPAVEQAGWWSLAGLALAAVVASFTVASLADLAADSAGLSAYRHVRDRLGVWPGRLGGVLGLAGRVVAAAAVADLVVAYVGLPAWAGVLVVVAICGAVAARREGGGHVLTLTLSAVVIVTLAAVVAAGWAISPVEPSTITQAGVPGSDDPTGILAAAGLLFFGFIGCDRVSGPARIGVRAVAAATAGTALIVVTALRQLGGPRLAVSPTPLRDLLDAADSAVLAPVLALGLLVGAGLAMFALVDGGAEVVADMADTRDLPAGLRAHGVIAVGAGASLVSLLTAPHVALAACLTLGSYALVNSAARMARFAFFRTGCCGLALSVIVAANISVSSLVTTVGVLIVGVVVCTLCARSADTT